jgi:hypothetical protein
VHSCVRTRRADEIIRLIYSRLFDAYRCSNLTRILTAFDLHLTQVNKSVGLRKRRGGWGGGREREGRRPHKQTTAGDWLLGSLAVLPRSNSRIWGVTFWQKVREKDVARAFGAVVPASAWLVVGRAPSSHRENRQ